MGALNMGALEYGVKKKLDPIIKGTIIKAPPCTTIYYKISFLFLPVNF